MYRPHHGAEGHGGEGVVEDGDGVEGEGDGEDAPGCMSASSERNSRGSSLVPS